MLSIPRSLKEEGRSTVEYLVELLRRDHFVDLVLFVEHQALQNSISKTESSWRVANVMRGKYESPFCASNMIHHFPGVWETHFFPDWASFCSAKVPSKKCNTFFTYLLHIFSNYYTRYKRSAALHCFLQAFSTNSKHGLKLVLSTVFDYRPMKLYSDPAYNQRMSDDCEGSWAVLMNDALFLLGINLHIQSIDRAKLQRMLTPRINEIAEIVKALKHVSFFASLSIFECFVFLSYDRIDFMQWEELAKLSKLAKVFATAAVHKVYRPDVSIDFVWRDFEEAFKFRTYFHGSIKFHYDTIRSYQDGNVYVAPSMFSQ